MNDRVGTFLTPSSEAVGGGRGWVFAIVGEGRWEIMADLPFMDIVYLDGRTNQSNQKSEPPA